MDTGTSSSTQSNDTTPTKGCPYCARCTVGEDCPWCGKQSLCDLCGVCFTEGCGYTRPEEEPEDVGEVADLLSERGETVREFGRRAMTPLRDPLREGGG